MITKNQLEEAFPGEDTDKAFQALKDYDKRDCHYLIAEYGSTTNFIGLNYLDGEELLLVILDSILHTCGVEYIAHKDDTQHEQLGLSYLNTGDGYVPTVIYDHKKNKWLIACWADLVEAHPNWYQ